MTIAQPIRVTENGAIWPVTITDATGDTLETTAELTELGACMLEGRFADDVDVALAGFTARKYGKDDDGMYVIWFETIYEN